MESRDKPSSPRALAGAKDAELVARRQREANEAVALTNHADFADDDDAGDHEGDDDDDDEEEVTTRVFEVELGGSSPWATAFLECASEGDLATLTNLLDDGKVELNDVDVDGFTALMISAAEAQDDVAMELLRRGADVSIRTHEMRSTALHFAAKSGAAQVVEAICTQDPLRVDAQNLDGDTPLVWACTEGRLEAVRVLLAHNANVNVVSHRAMSALICAVMLRESDGSDDELSDAEEVAATDADRAEIVRLLLAKNPKLVNYQDRDGSTAMHLAASHGYLECVKALLEFGADITLRNAIGQTPLEEAEETGIEAKSGKCIAHLRMIWKRLEEEAAARMMAMLEMEESWMVSGSQAGGGGPRSAKKTNKKKQKKAKRRTSKANASMAATEKSAEDKATVSSGEGSSDEEEVVSDKKHHVGDGGEHVAPVVLDSNASDKAKEMADEATNDEQKADVPQDGGVWTTVGRKHNQYLSQQAASASPADDTNDNEDEDSARSTQVDNSATLASKKKVAPVSPRSKPPRTTGTTVLTGTESTGRSASSRSRDKTTVKKVTPAKAKASTNRAADKHASRASTMSTAVYPPSSAAIPPPPPLAAFEAESLPVNSPFSTFQRLHNNSRLYERYERIPEAATDAISQARGSGSLGGLDSPYSSSLWRASPMGRSIHMPFSIGSSFGSNSMPVNAGHDSTSAPSSATIWRYNSPSFPQSYERASALSSKGFAPSDRVESRSSQSMADPVLRSLSCGLCGELVSDNLQCCNSMMLHSPPGSNAGDSGAICTSLTQCVQLYCTACVTRAVGSGESSSFSCVKCRLPLHPRDMKRNEFAQAQAAHASRSSTLHHLQHHQFLQRQHDPYEDMRLLMHRSSDRVRVAAVDPFYLVPGANLSALSVGQLDALEELHLDALQRITQARLENARHLERLRMEEWLKTQRDVFQFASHTSSS